MAVEKKQENKKNIMPLILILLWGCVFLLMKSNIIKIYVGTFILTLLYIYLNFNLINIYFLSKRTTFKIYVFMLLDLIYFLRGSFNLFSIMIYLISMTVLVFLIMKDEGKNELSKIYQFAGFYTVLKVIFILMLVFL
ncbi:phospholipid phosphatase [Leptotrichia sp. OH3620_COT-345]|uniref:phospholipid phosphatase n=1 Tax=Leptotrichia sp. OH3620_COT-345 TaxID=2491048 RepID=UPI000F646196|nr:phospholipid phosphatase [Leptotrichia sp. OH3620_COT-345]RRD40054.1 phospholipid phosphatase [Leptotrichia sp. OH3620_COT-345]